MFDDTIEHEALNPSRRAAHRLHLRHLAPGLERGGAGSRRGADRERGRSRRALSVTASLATRLSESVDANALAELAGKALEEGEEERALPLVERGAVRSRSALLWQWKALLERSLDEHERSARFVRGAAGSLRRTSASRMGMHAPQWKPGLDARPLYERALSLAPNDGQILLGMAAARAAMGEGDRAISDLQATVASGACLAIRP